MIKVNITIQIDKLSNLFFITKLSLVIMQNYPNKQFLPWTCHFKTLQVVSHYFKYPNGHCLYIITKLWDIQI